MRTAIHARATVVVEALQQLGLLTPDEVDLWNKVEAIANPVERNFRGLEVGVYRPVFRLGEA